ncbi:MAG TPA: hypothetical protein VIL04_09610 [Solirubrobacterales bacterium]|jgi:hypothetical protein
MTRGPGVFSFRAFVGFAVAALIGALALALPLATDAQAQSLPPICQQYPNLPECQEGPDEDEGDDTPTPPGDDEEEPDQTGLTPPGIGPTGDAGAAGKLPFTGYPLTGALLAFLILLASGLALRAYLATRDRLAAQGSPRP